MPSSVTIKPRPIYIEDLSLTTSNAPTLQSQTVGGLGITSLTPISAVLYSAFPAYANRAAATSGIGAGRIYYDTTLGTIAVTTG